MKILVESSLEEVNGCLVVSITARPAAGQPIGQDVEAQTWGRIIEKNKQDSIGNDKGLKAADSVPQRLAPRIRDPDRTPDQMLQLTVPRFEWNKKSEKKYKKLRFAELEDGRVMLSYSKGRCFTTKENVMKIPCPVPVGYLKMFHSNCAVAIRLYRAYLNSVRLRSSPQACQEDRKEEKEDPDEWKYKPILNTDTKVGKDDIDKVEGTLER